MIIVNSRLCNEKTNTIYNEPRYTYTKNFHNWPKKRMLLDFYGGLREIGDCRSAEAYLTKTFWLKHM